MATRPSEGLVYELQVTLLDTQPPIWRRIALSGARSMGDLHEAIQRAMGWTNSHLHAFRTSRGQPLITNPEFGIDYVAVIDEEEVMIADVLPGRGSRVVYEYDFGDSWEHEVAVEEIRVDPKAAKAVQCLAGARACPPEDVGGTPGYEVFLEALRDPKHPEHEEMAAWIGDAFDPERFDAAEATRALRAMGRRRR